MKLSDYRFVLCFGIVEVKITKNLATAEITRVDRHYAVQGHSRLLILISVETKAHMRLSISE